MSAALGQDAPDDDADAGIPTDTQPIQYGGFLADWRAWRASGDEGYETSSPVTRILLLPVLGLYGYLAYIVLNTRSPDLIGAGLLVCIGAYLAWAIFSSTDIRTQLQRDRHQAVGFLAAQELLSRPAEARPEDWRDHVVVPNDSPMLSRINGCGATFLRTCRFDPMTDSYLTVQYFTLVYLPIFPLRRYRVQQSEDNSFRLLARAPARPEDYLPLLGILGLVAALAYHA